ncbi:MAG: DUF3570 domain-containing protein [Rhizobacter sp.]
MQLNTCTATHTTGPLHLVLAGAVASLLGNAHAEGLKTGDWQVDSAVLIYQEGDGRVRAVEPIVAARRTDGNERSLGLRLTLDTLTGASPNGAVAQPTAQTFTNPSGRGGGYTTAAGVAPLDPRFHDKRLALQGSYERPLGEGQRVSFSGNVSNEHDFNSVSLSSSLTQDFNQKNSTLSLGLSFESDRIRPEGGVLAELKPAFGGSTRVAGSESRRVIDLLAGFTQVMSRSWLVQTSYNLGKGSGYHSDPYKVLSIIDGTTGLVTGDQYVVESRPRSRTRHSLSVQSKWHLTKDVVDVSYRYYRDDWGLRAHTLDARYRFELNGGLYLEPHARYYRQNAADFYRTWLTEGRDYTSVGSQSALPYASADTRLAAFSANTLGLKFGMPLTGGQELSLRVESYRQTLKEPGSVPGALQNLQLMPNLRATTLMLGYSLPF